MSWNRPAPDGECDLDGAPLEDAGEAVTRSDTRRLVHELLAAGRSRAEIARQLGVSEGTVSYHAQNFAGRNRRAQAREPPS